MSMYWGVWYRVADEQRPTLTTALEKIVGAQFEGRGVEGTTTAIGPDFSWDLVETDPALDDDELHLGDYPLWVRIRPRHAHNDSYWARDEARRLFDASRHLGFGELLVWDVLEVIDRAEPSGPHTELRQLPDRTSLRPLTAPDT